MVDATYLGSNLGNIGKGVDPDDPYASERERLMRFYSEFDPANATALVNAELGRRKAEQMFADAKSKIPVVSETPPKSELGRRIQSIVNVGGLYSSTPEEQAKIRQGKILDLAKGQVQSSTLEAGAKNLTPEQYADQKAQNLSAYDFLTRVQQGRATPGGTGTAPTYGDTKPAGASTTLGGNYDDSFNVMYYPPMAKSNFNDENAVPNPARNANNFNDESAIPNPNRVISPAERNALNIARRPAAPAPAAKPAAAPAAAPAQGGNFFTNLFKGGPEVQSTGGQLIQRQQGPIQQGQERAQTKLNWGDRDNAADFFRADKARQELEKSGESFSGLKRGGAAQSPGKDAALHKALEIIHHMITRGR
jgi:hypothetical protein